MPYTIAKVVGGYKVKKDGGQYMSKRPLTLERAKKQMIAIIINEVKNKG